MVKRFSSDIPSPRQSKVATSIHEMVSTMILRDEVINIKPLDISVTAVTVSPDLRQASVYVIPHPSGIGKNANPTKAISATAIKPMIAIARYSLRISETTLMPTNFETV